jgi:carbon storage regulator CsrA
MLILSRKVGEKIVIGDGITVVINRVAGDRVTIGLEAPPEVRILRGELRPFDDPRHDIARIASGSNYASRRDSRFETVAPARPR